MGKPKCEICFAKKVKLIPKVSLARFPLDPDRCREWVKATGLEDLAYLPIEKLHESKHICGSHFTRECFNKLGNRLVKSAIPTENLKGPPLSDEVLREFPLHIMDPRKEAAAAGLDSMSDPATSVSKIPATQHKTGSQHIKQNRTSDENNLSDDLNAKPIRLSKKPAKRRKKRQPLKIFNTSVGSCEPEKKITIYEQEIDYFGVYIAGMLKIVPRDVCAKLQVDIVNLIMNCEPIAEPPVVGDRGEAPAGNEVLEEIITMDKEHENAPIAHLPEDTIHDPRKDPNIPKPKKRPRTNRLPSKLTKFEEQAIDHFGTYITCLLKSVTNREFCTKIQIDLLNLILTAKLKYVPNSKCKENKRTY